MKWPVRAATRAILAEAIAAMEQATASDEPETDGRPVLVGDAPG